MGDLTLDTAVEPFGSGAYRATLSADWEIWGPMGGYVAACALRAAGAESALPRPAAFSCHYLSVARFGPVDLRVEPRRTGRTAQSLRVEVSQDGTPVLDAQCWSVADGLEGLEHDETVAPDLPGPEDLPPAPWDIGAEASPFPFWANLETRFSDREAQWPPDGPRPAVSRQWIRFRQGDFSDPWADAARAVVLCDLPSWPSAHRPHAWRRPPFTAPTLDLQVTFGRPATGCDWLLCDGAAPLSTAGLFGWTARMWSAGGRLHASGGSQCLYRRLPGGPASA